ncbi:Bro-N domain-containing protein [Delftia tsuruhatensis]
MQDVRVISEPDMLRLIVGSKLPAAERFERWVFEEVLPSIRKTGSYVDPQAPGALGACMQPLPYLSHVADFHVAADRVFRAVLRSARSAGLPLPQALRRANAVTQAQTGMDVLAMLNADDHLLALEAQARTAPARQHAGAGRFWQEWMAGGIDGLPYQTCLAAQAYSLCPLVQPEPGAGNCPARNLHRQRDRRRHPGRPAPAGESHAHRRRPPGPRRPGADGVRASARRAGRLGDCPGTVLR